MRMTYILALLAAFSSGCARSDSNQPLRPEESSETSVTGDGRVTTADGGEGSGGTGTGGTGASEPSPEGNPNNPQ